MDQAGTDYRIAVNVLSQLTPAELLYLADDVPRAERLLDAEPPKPAADHAIPG